MISRTHHTLMPMTTRLCTAPIRSRGLHALTAVLFAVATPLATSARNRPPDLGGPETEGPAPPVDEAGVELVAAATVDAVRNDRLYVFPHPDDLDAVRHRFATVLD